MCVRAMPFKMQLVTLLHFILVSGTGDKTDNELLNESMAAETETCEDLEDEDSNQEITTPVSIDRDNDNNEG